MIRRFTQLLAAACVLAAPALAHANKHYHASVCNKTKESVQVSYRTVKGMDQIGDVHPQGITHHSGGDKLEPAKCARLSFVVKYEGMLSLETIVELVFIVNNGRVSVGFSGVRHVSILDHITNPVGLKLSTGGKGEHFIIDVEKH